MSVKMVLGSYTFDLNPKIDFDIIKPKKHNSYKKTYTKVAYFNWGTSVIGQEIELSWDWMTLEQYDSLQTIYAADSQVLFDPVNTAGIKYNVQVTDLTGKYYIRMVKEGTEDTYRKDIKMKLLIMSEA